MRWEIKEKERKKEEEEHTLALCLNENVHNNTLIICLISLYRDPVTLTAWRGFIWIPCVFFLFPSDMCTIRTEQAVGSLPEALSPPNPTASPSSLPAPHPQLHPSSLVPPHFQPHPTAATQPLSGRQAPVLAPPSQLPQGETAWSQLVLLTHSTAA